MILTAVIMFVILVLADVYLFLAINKIVRDQNINNATFVSDMKMLLGMIQAIGEAPDKNTPRGWN